MTPQLPAPVVAVPTPPTIAEFFDAWADSLAVFERQLRTLANDMRDVIEMAPQVVSVLERV